MKTHRIVVSSEKISNKKARTMATSLTVSICP